MFKKDRALLITYQILAAIFLVSILTWVLDSFQSNLSTPIIALLFLLPVVISAGYLGITGGITASVASFLAFNYFFISPFLTFSVHHSQDLLALIVFLLVAVIISQSLSQAKINIASAKAREHETMLLYELTIALAGTMREEEILEIVGEKIVEHFPSEAVLFKLQPIAGDTRSRSFPIGSIIPERKPEICLEITGGGETTGEIAVWLKMPLDHPQDRLLRAFASQTDLVLGKAYLVDAERRAKLLEESDELKSTLLSSVSHELRTPLSTIKASISSLRSGEIEWNSEARQELLTAVEEETDHLNQLVGNLLDMSRIEIGALQPNQKNNSIKEILSGVIRRMRQQLASHQIKVNIPDTIPQVFVDYNQMDQVFINLLSNGIKYAPTGTEIVINSIPFNEKEIKIEVINQGPHVKPEHLTRIFDKFFRVTDADQVMGTGLGLSICKGIIEAHHGRIWAENRPEGFTFVFTVPVAPRQILPLINETADLP
ncbi:MAG: DUF4118 domain-containing protein [Leptolinea sp.]|nr:DUF4118 domain-containing protein [Leptolinea sp.]